MKVDSKILFGKLSARARITISGGSRISPRRGRQLPRGGAPTYDFAKFSPKLHEIERIWAPRGGARPKFYYVDPPLAMADTQPNYRNLCATGRIQIKVMTTLPFMYVFLG